MFERCPRCGYREAFAAAPAEVTPSLAALRAGRRTLPVPATERAQRTAAGRWPSPPPPDLLALADRLLAG
jgi:hypothetical protein